MGVLLKSHRDVLPVPRFQSDSTISITTLISHSFHEEWNGLAPYLLIAPPLEARVVVVVLAETTETKSFLSRSLRCVTRWFRIHTFYLVRIRKNWSASEESAIVSSTNTLCYHVFILCQATDLIAAEPMLWFDMYIYGRIQTFTKK